MTISCEGCEAIILLPLNGRIANLAKSILRAGKGVFSTLNILLKLLLNGLVAVPGLLWSGTTLLFAVIASLFLTMVSYALGDLVILPRSNNTFASLTDFILTFSLLWVACTIFYQPYRLSGLFLTAFAISVAEFFFHDYLQRRGVHHSKHPG
jgi:hypothetical protein